MSEENSDDRVLISDICKKVAAYLPENQIKQIYDAYLLAADAHDGQYRRSGEAYVFHPLSVAMILVDLEVDSDSIIAAILHDCIEDTSTTKEDIANQFGDPVAHIVDGVSRLEGLEHKSVGEKQAKNLRKLLFAASKDVRVLVIKLADRLHNMRTISSMPREKQVRIARETKEVYVPISRRIGIGKITKDLKLLCFKTIHPMRYKTLNLKLQAKYEKNQYLLRGAIELFSNKLTTNDIDAKVSGRKKDLVSIYNKMSGKKLRFNQILDLYGVRIVVDNITTCYQVLGLVHNSCKPVPGSFKDYIALPKNNGYQSLHTVVFGRNNQSIEVQIRTKEMEGIAAYGLASHWYYKDNNRNSNLSPHWIGSLFDNSDNSDDLFVENAKAEMSEDDVFVFTPTGDIIKLPYGSTALDFAYAVHTNIGEKSQEVRIDGVKHSLATKIKSGQTIEVLVGEVLNVAIKWLDIATTIKSRAAIKQTLKHEFTDSLELQGKKLLSDILYHNGIDIQKIRNWQTCLENLNLETTEELFSKIALKELLISKVIEALVGTPMTEVVVDRVENTQNIETHCAKCCNPLPGDEVLGILSTNKGLQIHRKNCIKLKNKDTSVLDWQVSEHDTFESKIVCDVGSNRGYLSKVVSCLSDANIDVRNIDIKEKPPATLLEIIIVVKDTAHLAEILHGLNNVDFVKKASRY